MGSCAPRGGNMALAKPKCLTNLPNKNTLHKNKRGYFFTLTVLVLIALVFLTVIVTRAPPYTKESDLKNTRVQETNAFLQEVQKDAQSALFIASFRAFLALEDHLLTENDYISSSQLQSLLQELLINGTIKNNPSSFMNLSTLTQWSNQTTTLANHIHVDLTITFEQINATHTDPWHITLTIPMAIIAKDTFTDASWNTQTTIQTKLPITNFIDPAYSIQTNQKYIQNIVISNATFPTNFLTHVQNQHYIASPKSPSYLDRLTGSFGAHPYGVESIINPKEMETIGIQQNGSLTDWIYLTDKDVPTCTIKNQPNWVILDVNRTLDYGVECV